MMAGFWNAVIWFSVVVAVAQNNTVSNPALRDTCFVEAVNNTLRDMWQQLKWNQVVFLCNCGG